MFGRRRLMGCAAGAAALAVLGAASAGANEPPGPLLPDLRARAQNHLTFSSISIFGGVTVNGCFPDEIVEDGARRCLRFDQSIANLGDGPFELRYRPPDYVADPFMYQRVYFSDGSTKDRKAEQYEFHATHAHFHYKGFAQSRLWRVDASGARLGGAPERVGRKNGFCVMDIERLRSNAPPAQYDGSGCTATREWVNGITAGWADTYTADLPDQYMEVSGVEDGLYELETLADPDGTVVELSETNNSVSILIRLQGDNVRYVRKVSEPTSAPPPPAQPPPGPPAGGGGASTGAKPGKSERRKSGKRRRCKSSRPRAGTRPTASSRAKKKKRCRRVSVRSRRR